MATLRYLLDTNIVSDLLRRPGGRLAKRISEVGEESVCISVIVAAELRYGARKSGSSALTERVDLLLSALQVVPLDEPADVAYGELRHHLAISGQPIGPNDLLIAAHALTLGLTLVTGNLREFERVPGLNLDNWLAAA